MTLVPYADVPLPKQRICSTESIQTMRWASCAGPPQAPTEQPLAFEVDVTQESMASLQTPVRDGSRCVRSSAIAKVSSSLGQPGIFADNAQIPLRTYTPWTDEEERRLI